MGDPNIYVLTVDSPAGGQDDDLLVGLIYNGLTGATTMVDARATRADGQVEVTVSTSWAQNDEDGLFASGKPANRLDHARRQTQTAFLRSIGGRRFWAFGGCGRIVSTKSLSATQPTACAAARSPDEG